MNKKKSNTTSSSNQTYQTNYGYMTPPITPETQSLIDMSNQPVAADPSIQHRYASMESELDRSYSDPFGAYTTPDVREKSFRSGKLKLLAERDKAMREGELDRQNIMFARKLGVAGFRQPQLVSTGGNSSGSGTQNTVQQGGFWEAVLPGIAGGAGAAAA
jgi:hypothetical protein